MKALVAKATRSDPSRSPGADASSTAASVRLPAADIGHYYYGPGHPMKPHRLKLTHHLVLGYGLYRKMECYRPHLASAEEIARFHSEDYVDFLHRVTPLNCKQLTSQMTKCEGGKWPRMRLLLHRVASGGSPALWRDEDRIHSAPATAGQGGAAATAGSGRWQRRGCGAAAFGARSLASVRRSPLAAYAASCPSL